MSLKAAAVFLTLSRLSDEGAEVPPRDMMAKADVRLGIRENARRRDGTPKRRLDRAAQRWFSPRNTSAKMTLLDRLRGSRGSEACLR